MPVSFYELCVYVVWGRAALIVHDFRTALRIPLRSLSELARLIIEVELRASTLFDRIMVLWTICCFRFEAGSRRKLISQTELSIASIPDNFLCHLLSHTISKLEGYLRSDQTLRWRCVWQLVSDQDILPLHAHQYKLNSFSMTDPLPYILGHNASGSRRDGDGEAWSKPHCHPVMAS